MKYFVSFVALLLVLSLLLLAPVTLHIGASDAFDVTTAICKRHAALTVTLRLPKRLYETGEAIATFGNELFCALPSFLGAPFAVVGDAVSEMVTLLFSLAEDELDGCTANVIT